MSIFCGLSAITLLVTQPVKGESPAQPALLQLIPEAETPEEAVKQSAEDGDTPVIQLAILLDTSSSMNGLIHQTRTELWSVVNLLNEARKDGNQPRLEVGLYEYGQDTIPASQNHLRMLSQFSGDLDQVSEHLFALQTNGGNEYSGAVIESATTELEWSQNDDALKIIFIAGNEGFAQGPIQYSKAISQAREEGIIINTIHCGNHDIGIRDKWSDGALQGNGGYFSINQNQEIQYIDAPQDKEIAALNQQLNKTYILAIMGIRKKLVYLAYPFFICDSPVLIGTSKVFEVGLCFNHVWSHLYLQSTS